MLAGAKSSSTVALLLPGDPDLPTTVTAPYCQTLAPSWSNYAGSPTYDFYRLRYVIAGAEKLLTTPVARPVVRVRHPASSKATAPPDYAGAGRQYADGFPGRHRRGSSCGLWPFQLIPVPGIPSGGMLRREGPQPDVQLPARHRARRSSRPPRRKGWSETNDGAEIDDGFVVVGRVNNFAKVAGEMVSLESVEARRCSLARRRPPLGQPIQPRREHPAVFHRPRRAHHPPAGLRATVAGGDRGAAPRRSRRPAAAVGTGKTTSPSNNGPRGLTSPGIHVRHRTLATLSSPQPSSPPAAPPGLITPQKTHRASVVGHLWP